MTDAEITAFLDEPGHLVRLGTVDPDGMPRVVPLWFLHDRGRIYFTPRAASAFLANLRRDPRVGMSIDEEAHPWRKVTVQGAAHLVHDVGSDAVWRAMYHRIAERYVTPAAAEAYIQATIREPRALFAVDLSLSLVSTWRMPVGAEDPRGIWAKRYYLAGTEGT